MKVTISWWDLSGSDQTIDSLGADLAAEGVRPWEDLPGLQMKLWFADPETNRWGAVMLLDESIDPSTDLPPNRAAELIGYPPATRLSAQVQAMVPKPPSVSAGERLKGGCS